MKNRGVLRLEPTDVVIWGTSVLLAVVLGFGATLWLWVRLRGVDAASLDAALLALAGGTCVLGLALRAPLTRAFLIALSGSVALGVIATLVGFVR